MFVHGILHYIVEFTIDAVAHKLDSQIRKKCEEGSNQYVRSASWTYTDWIDHPSLTVHYINKDLIGKSHVKGQYKICHPFYQKLIKLDPYSKENINPTDTQRSIRAYEVKQFTKKSLHDWFEHTKSYFNKDDFFKIYIDYPREELIQRISKRAELMIEMGAVNEVKRFLKFKIRKDKSVNKAIGINEIREYLEKRKDIDDVIEKISIKTRQYAKRQSTWARGNMVSWLKLAPQDLNKFLKKI